jgi:hypothetical protein
MEMRYVYREEGTEFMCICMYIYMHIIWIKFMLKRMELCLLHYGDGYNKSATAKLSLCLIKHHAVKAQPTAPYVPNLGSGWR